jgi:hypothetical protein
LAHMEHRVWRVFALLALLLSGVAVGVAVDDDGDGKPDRFIVTVPKKAPAGDLAAPAGPAVEKAAGSELRDETPADVPAAELGAGKIATEQLGRPLEPGVVGGAQNYSCRTDFSGRVWSSYSFRPTLGVLHYTVSANVAGWGDVNGIVSYFERTRVASADRVVDFEGNCTQMVPITTGKSWTQGAANGATCFSYEIIATGRETRQQWLSSPLIRQGILASMARDDAARCGIPLRRVDPSGCVFLPGITDHNALECGNDHTDVAPAFPWDVFMRQVQDGPKPVSLRARKLCQELNRRRRGGLEPGYELNRARALKKALAAGQAPPKYSCRYGPPGKITRR